MSVQKKEKKVIRFNLRCDNDFKKRISKLAKDSKMTMSEYIRKAIDLHDLLITGYTQYDNMYREFMGQVPTIINPDKGKETLRWIIQENLDIETIFTLNEKLGLED